MKISINCPSYKRPKVETLKYLPSTKVWVDVDEYDDYIKGNPGFEENIISVPKGIQGNLCRIRNYIIEQEFNDGIDVVLIIDDDMEGIYKFECEGNYGYKKIKLDEEDLYLLLWEGSILCEDFGFKFWGINCNEDKLSYRHTTPFSTISYIGGPFQVFLKGNECRYDEKLPLKEDYDMTLQNCNKYRGCLRINKYHYNCKQSKQKGGCATYRNYEREENQLKLLQKKWGKNIVKIDKAKNQNQKKKKINIDYNPIIKIPIKGV